MVRRPHPPSGYGTAPTVGRSLNHYEVLVPIGVGGMASVYAGRARGAAGFERLVALKRCHPHLRGDARFASMFLDEARLAAGIHHPNVVATLDVAEDDESLCLVMEYIEGEPLSRLIAASPAGIPVPVAVRVVADALAGLHAAHELCAADGTPLNLVHRDVSPQNVLVGVDGLSRIADFGIARARDQESFTAEGGFRGRLAYAAPERLRSGAATRQTDVFAAGVVLWEALTGFRLFDGGGELGTIDKVLREPVPPPSEVRPGIPGALDAVTLRALARDPSLRYRTAAEFAQALEQAAPPATPREVAAHLAAVCGASLAARRAKLREAAAGHAPGGAAAGASEGPPTGATAATATGAADGTATADTALSGNLPTPRPGAPRGRSARGPGASRAPRPCASPGPSR